MGTEQVAIATTAPAGPPSGDRAVADPVLGAPEDDADDLDEGQLVDVAEAGPSEVELLADGEVVDATTSEPRPGSPPIPEPADEVLETHELEGREPSADRLDRLDESLAETEAPSEHEETLDEFLARTIFTGRDEPETRYEELDEGEGPAPAALEPRPAGHRADEFLCSRCFLWRHRDLLVDPEHRICRDCGDDPGAVAG